MVTVDTVNTPIGKRYKIFFNGIYEHSIEETNNTFTIDKKGRYKSYEKALSTCKRKIKRKFGL